MLGLLKSPTKDSSLFMITWLLFLEGLSHAILHVEDCGSRVSRCAVCRRQFWRRCSVIASALS